MDNNPLNQHFHDEELVDIKKSKESWIFQHLENEVMDDEFEKVDELGFNEICQSLENENHCFKLKGSSAWCLEAIRNMNQAYHELDTKLKSLMKIWDRKFKETSEFLEMESMDHEFEEVDQLAFSQICQSYEYALLDFEKSKERISKDLENEVVTVP
uniref:Uncharacterized protein n=1 Tax=Solanum tuberosum TaxID=4113 RepID=M1DPN8_SOLTU